MSAQGITPVPNRFLSRPPPRPTGLPQAVFPLPTGLAFRRVRPPFGFLQPFAALPVGFFAPVAVGGVLAAVKIELYRRIERTFEAFGGLLGGDVQHGKPDRQRQCAQRFLRGRSQQDTATEVVT